MRKALSRFLLYVLLFLVIVLGTTCVLYVLNGDTLPFDTSEGNGFIPSLSTDINEKEEEYSRIENVSMDSVNPVNPVNSENDIVSSVGYEALDDENTRYLYEKLRETVYKISDEVDEKGRYKTSKVEVTGAEMDAVSINTAINAFLYDNPQVFWIDNYFGYYTTDNKTYVECYSVLSGNQCEIYIKRFSERLKEMLSIISTDDGKYEREKKLHDKLVEQCSYKHGIESFDDGWQYFSSYGALVGGEAVCEGYSKAMMLLLNLSGVNSVTIRGNGENERHMWNLVEIGGNWYHLDVTWDDMEDDEYNHQFFNLTDEAIKADHIIDPLLGNGDISSEDYSYNFFLPECTSEDMNYYSVDGVILNGTDDESLEALVNLLYIKAQSRDDIIPIKVGRDQDYDEFMNIMFDSETDKLFYDCIRKANEYLDDSHKINSHTSYLLRDEKRKTARVRIIFE